MLKFSVGILTHKVVTNDRVDLLEATVASVCQAFKGAEIVLFENGSWDGSADVAVELGARHGVRVVVHQIGDVAYTPGHGRNQMQRVMVAADVYVCSDDDMRWRPEARDVLSRFWAEEPVTILGGLLEPEWRWNTIRGVVESGGVKALVRDTAPAAAWSYRRPEAIYPLVEPIVEIGEDHEACLRLGTGKVAQVDVAEHLGWERSALGHKRPRGVEVDRARWGI